MLTLLFSNIDSHFQDRRFLMFPSKSIHTDGIRAGVMVSWSHGIFFRVFTLLFLSRRSVSAKSEGQH